METNEDKLLRLEFYQELLLPSIRKYPFHSLIIENKLSEKEVTEIYKLCCQLNDEYIHEKEAGFVTFLPLLTNFVGMLNYKIDPQKTIDALLKQGIYRELMTEFIKTNKEFT